MEITTTILLILIIIVIVFYLTKVAMYNDTCDIVKPKKITDIPLVTNILGI